MTVITVQTIQAQAHNDALEAAAQFLEGTAQDHDQMAAQVRTQISSMREPGSLRNTLREYEGKAQLLRGQAGHIRELRR